MPKLTGVQAARRLRDQRPDLQRLILSMHENEEFFFEALRAGAAGYVLKEAAEQDLAQACRAVPRGEPRRADALRDPARAHRAVTTAGAAKGG
jgi:DNA-binding NarL/FixJ family response regulator